MTLEETIENNEYNCEEKGEVNLEAGLILKKYKET